MTVFYENDPSLQSYWRSIVLYGNNVASYKFALAKSLIDLKGQPSDLIKLEDLAVPFSKHICEHLKTLSHHIIIDLCINHSVRGPQTGLFCVLLAVIFLVCSS